MNLNIIKDIKEKTNILEIIGDRVSLNRNHKGLCPFHEETRPSFSVNVNGGYFHCFGCGTGGDVFTYLELHNKMTFKDALVYLAEQAGIHVDGISDKDIDTIKRERTKYDILSETAKYYYDHLTEEIREYLKKDRGLLPETISQFFIGYANGGLRAHLENQGFPLSLCKEAGVIRDDGKDFFYKKIILPYFTKGRVILLRCRTDPSDLDKIYFPLKGYQAQIYNEDDLQGADQIVISEGELDALTIKQWEYNVVGVPGVNGFNEEWVKKFDRCKVVYIAFDSDNAGLKGAKDIANLLGEKAKIVALPKGEDVNHWYCAGHTKEDFQRLLDDSKTRLDIMIDEVETAPSSTKREELKLLFPELTKLDSVDLAYYRNRVCKTFDLTKPDFNRTLKKTKEEIAKKNVEKEYVEAQEQKPVELSNADKEAALKLLKSENLLEQFLKDIEQMGCVGEEENKVMVYLTLTSRIQENPISLIVKGESSSGKSFLVNKVAEFFPPEDIFTLTAITAKALYHWKDSLAHKALILQERHGAEESDYTIRTMQSEKHLVLLMPVKDPETNKFVTEEIKVEGPIAYIETTTRTHIHAENETRCFDIFPDESDEQTRRIFAQDNEKYKGNRANCDSKLKVWRDAQRLLEPHPLFIPFVEDIEFPEKPIRVRRDRSRFMALIEGNAVLHQHQREKVSIAGVRYIIATIEDYGIAYRLGNKVLSYTVGGLSPRIKELVEVCWRIAEKKAPSSSLEAIQALEFERKDIEIEFPCDKTWNRKTIYKYLKAADSEGFIELESQGRGKAIKIRVRKRIDDKSSYLLTPEEIVAKGKTKQSGLSKPVQSDDGQHSSLSFNELSQVSRADMPNDKTNFISQ